MRSSSAPETGRDRLVYQWVASNMTLCSTRLTVGCAQLPGISAGKPCSCVLLWNGG